MMREHRHLRLVRPAPGSAAETREHRQEAIRLQLTKLTKDDADRCATLADLYALVTRRAAGVGEHEALPLGWALVGSVMLAQAQRAAR